MALKSLSFRIWSAFCGIELTKFLTLEELLPRLFTSVLKRFWEW